MPTFFDGLEQSTFDRILGVMGEDALWLSSNGGDDIEGRILFNYPTNPMTIGHSDNYEYKPVNPTAEYWKDTFIGLKESTDQQNYEFLQVRGRKYLVKSVETKYDGDTYVANLELVSE